MDMDLLDKGFETISELPREIQTNELLGRKLYVDINKYFPFVFSTAEVTDWSSYSLNLTKRLQISFAKYSTSDNISYRYDLQNNILSIVFSEQVTPLEYRNIRNHIINEGLKCLRKKQSQNK